LALQSNLTGATIISDGGVDAVLIGGNSTDIGSQATLTDVNIFATGALIGLDATRMAPSWGCRVAASR
jgi:hypothetical protein